MTATAAPAKTCKGTNKAGKPCSRAPQKGSDYCHAHRNAEVVAEAAPEEPKVEAAKADKPAKAEKPAKKPTAKKPAKTGTPSNRVKTERNAEIVKAYKNEPDVPVAEIAKRHGIVPMRAQQILARELGPEWRDVRKKAAPADALPVRLPGTVFDAVQELTIKDKTIAQAVANPSYRHHGAFYSATLHLPNKKAVKALRDLIEERSLEIYSAEGKSTTQSKALSAAAKRMDKIVKS